MERLKFHLSLSPMDWEKNVIDTRPVLLLEDTCLPPPVGLPLIEYHRTFDGPCNNLVYPNYSNGGRFSCI